LPAWQFASLRLAFFLRAVRSLQVLAAAKCYWYGSGKATKQSVYVVADVRFMVPAGSQRKRYGEAKQVAVAKFLKRPAALW
jgi:hypothetical protein